MNHYEQISSDIDKAQLGKLQLVCSSWTMRCSFAGNTSMGKSDAVAEVWLANALMTVSGVIFFSIAIRNYILHADGVSYRRWQSPPVLQRKEQQRVCARSQSMRIAHFHKSRGACRACSSEWGIRSLDCAVEGRKRLADNRASLFRMNDSLLGLERLKRLTAAAFSSNSSTRSSFSERPLTTCGSWSKVIVDLSILFYNFYFVMKL